MSRRPGCHAISDTGFRQDALWPVWIHLDLLPEVTNVHAQSRHIRVCLVPGSVEEVAMCETSRARAGTASEPADEAYARAISCLLRE
jgi:hypothetical protein